MVTVTAPVKASVMRRVYASRLFIVKLEKLEAALICALNFVDCVTKIEKCIKRL